MNKMENTCTEGIYLNKTGGDDLLEKKTTSYHSLCLSTLLYLMKTMLTNFKHKYDNIHIVGQSI